MSAWVWMARRYGVRLTWRYWRQGRSRGWMTAEEFRKFIHWIDANAAEVSREALVIAMDERTGKA